MGRSVHRCLEVQVSSYWLRIILCSMKDSHVHKLYRPFTWNASLYGERCMLFRTWYHKLHFLFWPASTDTLHLPPKYPSLYPLASIQWSHTYLALAYTTFIFQMLSVTCQGIPLCWLFMLPNKPRILSFTTKDLLSHSLQLSFDFSQQSVICKYYAFSFSKLCTKLSSVNQLRLRALISSKK